MSRERRLNESILALIGYVLSVKDLCRLLNKLDISFQRNIFVLRFLCRLSSSGCPIDRGPRELWCFTLRYPRWVNPNFPSTSSVDASQTCKELLAETSYCFLLNLRHLRITNERIAVGSLHCACSLEEEHLAQWNRGWDFDCFRRSIPSLWSRYLNAYINGTSQAFALCHCICYLYSIFISSKVFSVIRFPTAWVLWFSWCSDWTADRKTRNLCSHSASCKGVSSLASGTAVRPKQQSSVLLFNYLAVCTASMQLEREADH